MQGATRKHLARRVRNLYQEIDHGRIFSVVYLVYPLLASRTAGCRIVSHRLAHHFALSPRWNRGTRSLCSPLRAFFPSGAAIARATRDLAHGFFLDSR